MYYYQQIRTSHPELIAELERRLRVQDAVIKYQTVRLDEDLKRQKKLTERREKRSARRPRRATAPAATPPTPPATPATPAAAPEQNAPAS
jgi:small subunit ribosomal protein S6